MKKNKGDIDSKSNITRKIPYNFSTQLGLPLRNDDIKIEKKISFCVGANFWEHFPFQ